MAAVRSLYWKVTPEARSKYGADNEAAYIAHARRKIHDVHARIPIDITTEAPQCLSCDIYTLRIHSNRAAHGGRITQEHPAKEQSISANGDSPLWF